MAWNGMEGEYIRGYLYMKAWEICKKENVGKKFKGSNGKEWKVCKHVFNSTYYDLEDRFGNHISKQYYMSTIAELDFEEAIDWSKVPVDTKILVANYDSEGEAIEWKKRHFAKYENGIVYAWNNGMTSFTAKLDGSCINWDCAKLYEEGEE